MRQKKLSLDKVDEDGKLVTRRQKKQFTSSEKRPPSWKKSVAILKEKDHHLDSKRPPSLKKKAAITIKFLDFILNVSYNSSVIVSISFVSRKSCFSLTGHKDYIYMAHDMYQFTSSERRPPSWKRKADILEEIGHHLERKRSPT